MRQSNVRKFLIVFLPVILCACDRQQAQTSSEQLQGKVDSARIINAHPNEWLSHGRSYDEQRHSPLTQINRKNVSSLGLAWYFDLPTRRGVETTPLMADGVLYVTTPWSMVIALNAKTGEQLWHYDPEVPKDWSRNTCCDVVNRGVGLWGDKVYVGTIDGRLVALNREDGGVSWDVDTRINETDAYSITGAPRIINGKVIIGNGGAEMGVRGYATAYDAETGKQVWRFYTVPGNPADGFEDDTQQWIAETWTGEWWLHGKGGGTAWDSFSFDPELNLLYIGVGNGSPWNHKTRSPQGGDNLFLSSIVAVNADTGQYVWHYQTTPGENWDYTATQQMILADIEIDGELRKVIIQAPKNGFFYVLDRVTGELLSAEPYMTINWATHVDMATGRPVETAEARRSDWIISPGPKGAHNWQPMSYSPTTGLVYVPAMRNGAVYADDDHVKHRKTIWNINYPPQMVPVTENLTKKKRKTLAKSLRAFMVALNPSTGKIAWRLKQGFYSAGGILSTAGDLLFQGDLDGYFNAYDARTGAKLWSDKVQSGIMAGPISYAIDGTQYIAVAQGWGGETSIPLGTILGPKSSINVSRILVYKLGGNRPLPIIETSEQSIPTHSLPTPHKEQVERGRYLYNVFCHTCHGDNAISAGIIPDLRYRIGDVAPAWQAIVLEGALRSNGMPAWKEFLTPEEAVAIKSYVIHEANLGIARSEKRLVSKAD